MTDGRAEHGTDDETTVAVDIYGIKVKARPSASGEEPPTTWKEASEQVKRHLIRIAAGPTRLIADALDGAARLVQGISRLPSSAVMRLDGSHREAERRERERQDEAANERPPHHLLQTSSIVAGNRSEGASKGAALATSAVSRIEAILEYYRKQGTDAYVIIGANGKIIVVIGMPKDDDARLIRVLQDAQLLLVHLPEE